MSKIYDEPYALSIIGRFFPSCHKDNGKTGIPRYESDYWLHRFYPLSISFLYCVFSERRRCGRRESNPQRRCLLVGAAPSLVACVATFVAIRAASGLLARDAHPFALSLLCLHGRGLTGSRIKGAHLAGVPSGWGWRCVQSYPLRIISVTNTSPSRQSALRCSGFSYR